MTRTTTRALVGAAITVLLGSVAVAPAMADPVAAPVVTWNVTPTTVAEAGNYDYGTVPLAPTCTVIADPVAPCAVTGYETTVGVHALVAMVGAPAVAVTPPLTYTVTATWTLKGFYRSVKENGSWNTRKGGSTIPLKFKIYDGEGDKSKTVTDISSFLATPIPCKNETAAVGTTTIDLKAAVAKKGQTLRYRDGAFHKNWKTSKLKATTVPVASKGHGKAKSKKVIVPSCYQVTMTALDGQSLTALFRLK